MGRTGRARTWMIGLGTFVLISAPVWGQLSGSASQSETQSQETPSTSDEDSRHAEDGPASQSTGGRSEETTEIVQPLIILAIGIAVVLGLIIGLKVNAFIALITAAIVVSLLSVGLLGQGSWAGSIGRVATAFGKATGNIGIVIAMAAVIGKCMLDSGAADRIVRTFLKALGEKNAPVALMGSGFVLAVPVFFDTVFYLLVPLARSLHRSTNRNYLLYLMAIGAGGAITHTLVPPTPGPLMMASNLGFDVGIMILVGTCVALPAAVVGVICARFMDARMNVPMRQVGSEPEPKPLKDEDLPSLFLSLLPVLLPVVLIATNTVLTTIADSEHAALLKDADVDDRPQLRAQIQAEAAANSPSPGRRIVELLRSSDSEEAKQVADLIQQKESLSEEQQEQLLKGLNEFVLPRKDYHRGDEEESFLCILPNKVARDLLKQPRLRMKKVDVERMNRALLESAYVARITAHDWNTPMRGWANFSSLFGNANLVLLISTVVALWLVVKQRGLSRTELAGVVETSLMSGGVIILITAGGGAFGAMLEVAQIGPAIQSLFSGSESQGGSQFVLLFLAFLLGSLMKIAQGSGTVAMIVGTSMMAAIVGPIDLTFHPVYLACSVGAGSLVCSWMNDSGFWIVAKMGGLTEVETLKSWTILLVILGFTSFMVTVVISFVLPMAQ